MARRTALALAVICLAIFLYEAVLRLSLLPYTPLPAFFGNIHALTLFLLLFSLLHAAYALGTRHALLFFALTAIISWGYEQVGVATGWVYGAYHYTDVLGPKVGYVPALIPLAWFMMIYPSYVIANLISRGRPYGSGGTLGGVIWLALLSGAVMTAWDLVIDPILSASNVQAWIWEEGGPYFGIPACNFAGWMLTTVTVYLAYSLYEWRMPPPISATSHAAAGLPLVAYGAMLCSDLLVGGPPALVIIAPFVMGVPVLVAAERWWRCRAAAP